MKKLVILRPEPGASASAARAEAMGLEAIAVPLFETVAVEWSADASRYDAILATSANAFRLGEANLGSVSNLPVHAVGGATAEAARLAGFDVVAVGEGGVEGMALPGGRLLHLAGRDHVAVAGAEAVIVYEARAIDPPPVLDAVHGAVVAVHSARAGARLAELVDEKSDVMIVAISAAAAGACGLGWAMVVVAEAPRDTAVLALARRLCQNVER